jgi:ABC transporter substrate binding protein
MWPFAAHAQQPSKMKRLAIVEPVAKSTDVSIEGSPLYVIFFREMKRLGYVEGDNLIVDRYCLDAQYDRVREVMREAVARRPDVIFTVSNYLTLALKSETRTIPIVAWMGDPVASGIVSSLARPGENITGVLTPGRKSQASAWSFSPRPLVACPTFASCKHRRKPVSRLL